MDALKTLVTNRAAAESVTVEVKAGRTMRDHSLRKEGIYILAPDDDLGPNGFPSDFKRDVKLSFPVLVRARDLRADDSAERRLIVLTGLVFDAVGADITISGTCDKALPMNGSVQESQDGELVTYEELLTVEAQLVYRMK